MFSDHSETGAPWGKLEKLAKLDKATLISKMEYNQGNYLMKNLGL